MLEAIFERTVRPCFAEIFRCHCHLQCQICFGLGDGQDTEGFSNIRVSLGCSHCFYTKVCSQMTSNGDLCHVGTSKLISETNRWTGPCMIQFLPKVRWEAMLGHWCESGKYTTVLCFGIGRGDSRSLPHFTHEVRRVSGAFSVVLSHYKIGVCFSFWYEWNYVMSRKYRSTVTV